MAVVSRISTIKFDNTLGSTKTFTMTATTQDTAAGGSVSVTIVRADVGAIPPADPDNITYGYYNDAGTLIRQTSTNNPTFPINDTFFFTDTGLTGGSARCGTVELKMRVTKTTGGPTATYDVETDGAPNTPPTTFTTTQLDRGWVRGTTTLTESLSNISLGGGKNSPAEYDESLFVRLTSGAVSYVARALSVTISGASPTLSGSTNSTTATQRDVTFSNVVDNRFPATSTTINISAAAPDSTLTGLSDWTYTSTTDDSMAVDPRLTCAHLLQIDDNSFGTPPLIKNNSTGQRLTSQIGYLSTNLRGARGTVTGSVVTEGRNAVNVHTSLQDTAQATTAITQDADTATRGGETGWVQSMMQWTSSLPGGSWTKTVSINSPSDITGASYLLNSTVVYTLLAIDPAIRLLLGAGPTAGFEGRHFTAGLPLTVGGALYSILTAATVTPDVTPTPTVAIFRFNQSTGKSQFLRSDYTWQNLAGSTANTFTLTQSPTDSGLYVRSYSAVQTAAGNGWDASDLFVVVVLYYNGTPYSDVMQISAVSDKNLHDSYAFDSIDFATGFAFK